MIPPLLSEQAPLSFDIENGILSQKIKVTADRIRWLHAEADQPGAQYDFTIRDALGQKRLERKGFGTEHEKSGELIDLATMVGEEIEIEISNPRNMKTLKMFVN